MLTVLLPIYDSLVVPVPETFVWGVEIKEVARLFDSEFYELWQAWLNFESSLATAPYKQDIFDSKWEAALSRAAKAARNTYSNWVRLVRSPIHKLRWIKSGYYLDNIITVLRIRVKVPYFKVRSYSRSAHTEVNHQGEAGNRAQSEPKQIRHTGANGEVPWWT